MKELKSKINKNALPKHVAIIMDGNGRWAKSRGEERTYGHRNGIQAVRDVVYACQEIQIPYLTLYTFSTENWKRPQDEVATLMQLLAETLTEEADDLYTKGLRLRIIGDINKMPPIVKEQLYHIMDLTRNNTGGNLILALNYGAQAEIIQAVQSIAKDVKNGELNIEDIDHSLFEDHLYTKDIPPVDLMIRTSGEVRISNFLLWQIAYAELQFLDILWPDFTKKDFFNCIIQYQEKERRYGKISEQIEAKKA
ncbi:isoprenyl transferase [Elizabethkingia argentiflava]|uniref:Isoprenyl transferase n=1 Tax=Elizabethkingia argenteiflava TaxID=2681556 RepID=A0A845PTY4_9FLAO|nr:isoprenyl transferase [Elizabethkingia argenteiflava]NAW51692.1 isoprenyl transferase [Elizabethkingia argenteiflava]